MAWGTWSTMIEESKRRNKRLRKLVSTYGAMSLANLAEISVSAAMSLLKSSVEGNFDASIFFSANSSKGFLSFQTNESGFVVCRRRRILTFVPLALSFSARAASFSRVAATAGKPAARATADGRRSVMV